MDFLITNLMEREACLDWIRKYFHPDGSDVRIARQDLNKRSQLDVYRCVNCKGIHNLYSRLYWQ